MINNGARGGRAKDRGERTLFLCPAKSRWPTFSKRRLSFDSSDSPEDIETMFDMKRYRE